MADELLESGIWIPDRDPDKGYPIVQVILDGYAGQIVNIAGPEESDVALWAAKLEDCRRDLEAGNEVGPLRFVEPAYGETCWLMPAALPHVALVCRGFMAKVAVQAMKDQHGPQQAPPDPFRRG